MDIPEKIITTKNQTFGGVHIRQTWTALFYLEQVINSYKPDIIIELGTGYGALTLFFSLHAQVVTFDKIDNVAQNVPHVHYKIRDIFDCNSIQIIKFLIEHNDKVFLFCDGGDKPKEFLTFTPLLKPGDLIFIHDYKIEITDEQMKPIIKKYYLVPYQEKTANELQTRIIGFISQPPAPRARSQHQAVGATDEVCAQ